jgi:hypothetical protein
MAQTDQMKTFLDYLEEAEKKTKTKDQSTDTDWSGLDDLFKPKADQPLARINDDPKDQDDELPADDGDRRKKASQRDTLRAAGNIEPNQRMRDLLGRMRDIEADDDEGYPDDEPEVLPDVRVDTENLPAIAGRALQAAGAQDPKFHKVANLPGNMSRAIRTLGKQLFRSFTSTDTDDIWMVGNLNGQGPNSRSEINAVAGFVRDQGEEVSVGDIDFDTSIPGYTADIRQYRAAGIRWLLVRDEFGDYVYSWPESDSRDARNTPEIGRDPARLPNR